MTKLQPALALLARCLLAFIFLYEGIAKVENYGMIVDYMEAHGVSGRLLPLVILTEILGGSLPHFVAARCCPSSEIHHGSECSPQGLALLT